MAQLWNPGGAARTALCAGLGGNVVASNTVNRRADQNVLKPSIMRIIGTVGTACSYTIEGSPDGTFFFPLPYIDYSTPGPVGVSTSAVYTVAAAGTWWLTLPVNEPWSVLRVTMSANTNMVNQIDCWCW